MVQISNNFAILAVVVLLIGTHQEVQAFFTGARNTDLSYFFGARLATDTLCYDRTITKGSKTPIQVMYNNPAGKVINFVTIQSDKFSKYGFRVFIESGAIGTREISFRLTGKHKMPYNVFFQYWCAA